MARTPKQKLPRKHGAGGKAGPSSSSSGAVTDPRFSHLSTDPRFRLPSKKHDKIVLDERFQSILQDDDFAKKAKVDRYGQRIDSDAGKKELKRFYRLEEEEEEEDGSKKFDPAREGFDTSSSESESEDEDLIDEPETTQVEETLKRTDVPMGEVSRRLAVVNMDWDHIKAEDLMVAFTSFVPPNGRILKVSVYPSGFGKERLEREEIEGPPREVFRSGDASDSEEEVTAENLVKEDAGQEVDNNKLRLYQLERLRYYYAVLQLDSPATGEAIYKSCDGAEFQTSANFFDLRFIPDEVSFDEDEPRDECDAKPEDYKPTEFVTDALQHSKVKLTWDQDDVTRKERTGKAFSRREIEENDLKAYLASSSSESEFDEGGLSSKRDAERSRMRALLGLKDEIEDEEEEELPTGDMQVTFSGGLKGSSGGVFENEPPIEETTLEKYVRKERERKQRRKERAKGIIRPEDAAAEKEKEAAVQEIDLGFDDPFFNNPDKARQEKKEKSKREERRTKESMSEKDRAELELLLQPDDNSHNKQIEHFNMSSILAAEKNKGKKLNRFEKKKKEKKEKTFQDLQQNFKMDVKDERFRGVFEDHELAIDPSHKGFVATTGMKELLEEGRRNRANQAEEADMRGKSSNKKRQGIDEDDVRRLVEKVKRKKL